jgi:predicted DNA binding CopG/RHH family protein
MKNPKKRKTEKLSVRRKKPIQRAGKLNPDIVDMEDVTPILKFLADFQKLANPTAQQPSRLISIKIPVPMLEAFRYKTQQSGIPYQTMIKRLMEEWLQKA